MVYYDVSKLQIRNLSVKIKQMRHNTLASSYRAKSNVRQAATTGDNGFSQNQGKVLTTRKQGH